MSAEAEAPVILTAGQEEAIAFNLCSLHGFDPDFVKTQRSFALAVIREYEISKPRLAPTAPVETVGETDAFWGNVVTGADALRAAGWSVAVHNDYRLKGEAHTFWLWTHPDGRWVKGEGRTDDEALSQCLSATQPDTGKVEAGGVEREAVAAIAAERQRQVDVEGWSEGHDDEHDDYQMARAAGCYALSAGRDGSDNGFFDSVVDAAIHHSWPWDRSWWKPKDRRSDLVRAGALIVAEIERLDRSALLAAPADGGEG